MAAEQILASIRTDYALGGAGGNAVFAPACERRDFQRPRADSLFAAAKVSILRTLLRIQTGHLSAGLSPPARHADAAPDTYKMKTSVVS